MSLSSLLQRLCHAGAPTLAALLVLFSPARGATTDIAQTPLATASTVNVLPNVLFVLDDSGSMNYTYLPDGASNFSGKYGIKSSQCNGVYYDPNVTYLPPLDATGASYPNATFTNAWDNGFNQGGSKTNLSNSYYYKYKGSVNKSGVKLSDYSSSGSTFYKECHSSIGSSPGSGVFDKITVSATSGPGGTDERTNYANWYSYYRTRMLMMKTAVSRAFASIGDHYRV
jgi:type IV pilus assembly protein PilY1